MALTERLAAALPVRVLALAAVAHLRVLPRGARLARERALVDLELDRTRKANIGGNAVADGESDQVAGEDGVGERGVGASITN